MCFLPAFLLVTVCVVFWVIGVLYMAGCFLNRYVRLYGTSMVAYAGAFSLDLESQHLMTLNIAPYTAL